MPQIHDLQHPVQGLGGLSSQNLLRKCGSGVPPQEDRLHVSYRCWQGVLVAATRSFFYVDIDEFVMIVYEQVAILLTRRLF